MLATGIGSEDALAVDGEFVYFSKNSGEISRVPKHGGAAAVFHPEYPTTLATDSSYVYWFHQPTASLRSTSKLGGKTEILTSNQQVPSQLIVDASQLFWAPKYSGEVFSWLKPTGPTALRYDSESTDSLRFAVDETHIFVAHPGGLVVAVNRTDNLPPTSLAELSVELLDIGVSEESIFLASADGQIFSLPKGGGATTSIAAIAANRLAIDGPYVYATSKPNGIFRIPDAGGDPELVAPDVGSWSVVLDDECVYWTNPKTLSVNFASKPPG